MAALLALSVVFLSFVIPAYNEESRIGPTLRDTIAYLKEQSYDAEIIVVNDGSTDGTSRVVRDFMDSGIVRLVENDGNRGKGYSVAHGMLKAKGDLIIFSDADQSIPVKDIARLLPAVEEGYDVAIGSRGVDRSMVKVHQPFFREFMGRVFNFLVQLISVRGFQDTQCGFKLFTRKAAHDIFTRQHIERFAFDVEAIFVAVKRGYKVTEIPVEWYNSPKSTVNPLSDSTRMFLDLLVIRRNHALGVYDEPRQELLALMPPDENQQQPTPTTDNATTSPKAS